MTICCENLFSENVGLRSKKLQKMISVYVKTDWLALSYIFHK